jgi:SPP1 family predicted phage head-tail adaptor
VTIETVRLDRRVKILQRVTTRNEADGTDVVSWVLLAKVWAELKDVLPGRAERLADVVSIERRPVQMRARWRDDVTIDMRLEYRGRQYRIVSGPAMLGRRKGMEILAELLVPEGQKP